MATLKLIKQPFTFTFSRNPVLFRFRVTPFGTDDIEMNTRVNISLETESEHMAFDTTERKAVSLRPDANGYCEIDFQSVLNAMLEFYVPHPKRLNAQVCRKQSLFYRIKYYLSNDYEAITDAQYTPFFIVIKGGLGKAQMDVKTYFESKTPFGGVKKFMRYDYDGERLSVRQPIWLFCLLPALSAAITSVKLSIFTEVESGAVHIYTQDTILRAWSGGILCVPAGIGPYQFNLPYYKDAILIRYELRDNNLNLLAETDDIYLDHRNYYNSHFLFFHTSIGGGDTLMLTGVTQSKGNYDKEKSLKTKAVEYDQTGRIIPEEEHRSSREKFIRAGRTGYLPEARIDMLRDIFNSNIAYEFISVPGTLSLNKLVPVNIPGEEAVLISSDEQLHSVQIEWESAFADENYTPDNSVPIATICPAVEFFSIGQTIGQNVFVEWQLSDTYERIEIRMSNDPVHTANDATDIFFFNSNQGAENIEIHYPFSLNLTVTVYLWARTICDTNVPESSYSAGPWTAKQTIVIYMLAAPIVRNDFTSTYKGADNRAITFKNNATSVFANDTKLTGPGALKIINPSVTGSAGGTLMLDAINGTASYTPVNANYTGTEVFTYPVVEEVLLPSPFELTQSAPATAKLYVTVNDFVGAGVPGTGKPFVRLLLTNYRNREGSSGNLTTYADMYLQFFADAAGTVPMDVSALGLIVQYQETYQVNNTPPGTQPPVNVVCSGTQTYVGAIITYDGNTITGYTNTRQYNLVPSADYFII